ncbi:hypothetical protein [Niabella aurantiaca]|uniref:hypothetical protein n=1 Tax=Niabella aurantiaca TaxID=379900 RepID=UPI000369A67B|nr:hypothetical protein [Niabella aurantiaca]
MYRKDYLLRPLNDLFRALAGKVLGLIEADKTADALTVIHERYSGAIIDGVLNNDHAITEKTNYDELLIQASLLFLKLKALKRAGDQSHKLLKDQYIDYARKVISLKPGIFDLSLQSDLNQALNDRY